MSHALNSKLLNKKNEVVALAINPTRSTNRDPKIHTVTHDVDFFKITKRTTKHHSFNYNFTMRTIR
ncbi:hypothetical protein J32TS6_13950 [Virgibacillus pantothenticus]|nr:hypothetical protein J32TS6_13950 [Virgibacillus pantothenticus]